MMCTSFWHPDGTPMSIHQSVGTLFGKHPEFLKDEDELRAPWKDPLTCHPQEPSKRFCRERLRARTTREMQKIINAEKSDLFDVLAYVAYTLAPLDREERAARAQIAISGQFNNKLQAFLAFVLAHYVSQGVEELDQEKLGPLLQLKYHSINDALEDLGPAEEVGHAFAGFQQHLS